MAPRPEVTALRAMIAVGVVIVVGKMVLRRYNIEWPPDAIRIPSVEAPLRQPRWTFSETIADVHPSKWRAILKS